MQGTKNPETSDLKRRVLVVDDEEEMVDLIREPLLREGFDVLTAFTGRDALAVVRSQKPDMVLLDLMLPDVDGLEICRQLKWDPATASIPVLIITGKSDEADVVLGLGLGAEDYLVKPFRLKELVARIKVIYRRLDNAPELRTPKQRLAVDSATGETKVDGKPVALRPTEQRLMRALAIHAGTVLSRAELLAASSSTADEVNERTIDVHIQSIRRKLRDQARRIATVRGTGYMLER